MLWPVVGDLLPAAVAVALSPVPIVAIVLMLGTTRARSIGPAFALGWAAGLAVVMALVVVAIGSGSDDGEAQTSAFVAWLQVAFGVMFLVLAVAQWRGRPRDGVAPEPPSWMASLDTVSPLRALVLGAALSGANPKSLALTVSAAATVGDAGLSAGASVAAAAVFVVIGSVSVVGPTVWYLVAPQRAAAPLESVKTFMSTHSVVIMMTVLLLLGAKLLGNGIAGLAD